MQVFNLSDFEYMNATSCVTISQKDLVKILNKYPPKGNSKTAGETKVPQENIFDILESFRFNG